MTEQTPGIGHNNPPEPIAHLGGRRSGQTNAAPISNVKTLMALTASRRVEKNLWLYVNGSGKSWVYEKMWQGKTMSLGLGPFPDVNLTDAREKVREYNEMLAKGQDPRKPKVRRTFRDVLPLWTQKAKVEWTSERYGKSVLVEIDRYLLPWLGDLDINEIETSDVVECLMQDVGIEDAAFWLTRHVTAYRCKGYAREIIGYALAMKWRQPGNGNPAQWEDCLEHLLANPKKIHAPKPFASIHHSEIRAFMKTLATMKGLQFRCLESLIHCGLRTQEAMGARWPELDLDAATWTVPGTRMKKRREHTVPLSQQAVALFRALQKGATGELVFGDLDAEALRDAVTAVMDKAGRKWLDKKTGEVAVPHGFRSSAATWWADQGVDDGLIDLALAHVVGSEVLRRYQRSDKIDQRRKIMQQWSDHLTG